MKKILFTIFAGAIALLSSCSKDITEEPQSGGSTFSIEIPGDLSRATSGTSITRYIVEAYEAKNLSSTPITAESSTGSLSLTLKKNTEYTFLFWADGGADKYTATSLQNIKPATPTAAGTRAFCLKTEFNSKDFEANKNIVLKGAVAQLNFVETSAKLEKPENSLKVTYADLGSLNVATGVITPNATTTPVTRNFATNATTGTIATDYILADINGATADLKVQFNSETEKSITAVTFKANYRTNLKGEYSGIYNSTITVSVDDIEWSNPDIDNDLSYKGDYEWYIKGEVSGKYEIGNITQLRELEKITNNKLEGVPTGVRLDNFAGKTITLTADIDLKNEEWTPIGNYGDFKGTFDGNGKTISNLKITKNVDQGHEFFLGLFSEISLATIKDLTIENTDISMTANKIYGAYVGSLVGVARSSLIQNVTVKGNLNIAINTLEGFPYIGGICGLNNNDAVTIINCVVYPTTAENHLIGKGSGMYIGGIGGKIGPSDVSNIINCYSTANIKGESLESSFDIGGLYGSDKNSCFNSYASGDIDLTYTVVDGYTYRLGGLSGSAGSGTLKNSFALSSKIKVTSTSSKITTGKISGYKYSSTFTDVFANPDMNYILNGVENSTFNGGENGVDLTASPSAPWWNVPGGKSIVDRLNEYVTANPTFDYKGTTVTLKKWKTGTSKECPAVFVD